MGFRITTNMMMNSYRYNLQNSTNKLANARDKVLTQRNFNSYAEDPAAATLAFRLRRNYCEASNQLSSTKDTYGKFNTAWHNLQGIIKDLGNANSKMASIQGPNGTAGESRIALAQVLRETGNSVIQAMNQKLGDHFVFGGNDALNVPFEWDDSGEYLTYRGVNVNAGAVQNPKTAQTPIQEPTWLNDAKTAAGTNWTDTDQAWYDYYSGVPDAPAPDADTRPQWAKEMLEKTAADVDEKAWLNYYKDRDDVTRLNKMKDEKMYLDMGMGMAEHAPNQPVNGTYFNSALAGINFVGYGVDEDGDPKNFALIMKDLANVFDGWRESGQMYLPEQYRDMTAEQLEGAMKNDDVKKEIEDYNAEQEAKAFRLMDKLKKAQESLTESHVALDAQSSYLQTNQELLSTQMTDLNVQILDIEQVDLADAITSFSWEQYCYNSALKIGNQLLSQSLIDYMR
mgnify:CR=1 FL=1